MPFLQERCKWRGRGSFACCERLDFVSKRIGTAAKRGHQLAFAVDQELVKVPTDFVVSSAVEGFLGQPCVHRVLVVPFTFTLDII